MRRIDMMDWVVYVVQLMLGIPFFYLVKPLADWLNRFHWPLWVEIGVGVILLLILWLITVNIVAYLVFKIIKIR